jgi:putative transposase
MSVQRNHHGPELKARVAIEAIKEQKTVNEIASENRLHPGMVSRWKKQLLENVIELFSSKKELREKGEEALRDQLYQEIGQLKVELDWLKKKTGFIG